MKCDYKEVQKLPTTVGSIVTLPFLEFGSSYYILKAGSHGKLYIRAFTKNRMIRFYKRTAITPKDVVVIINKSNKTASVFEIIAFRKEYNAKMIHYEELNNESSNIFINQTLDELKTH